jgi:hypothetical protein
MPIRSCRSIPKRIQRLPTIGHCGFGAVCHAPSGSIFPPFVYRSARCSSHQTSAHLVNAAAFRHEPSLLSRAKSALHGMSRPDVTVQRPTAGGGRLRRFLIGVLAAVAACSRTSEPAPAKPSMTGPRVARANLPPHFREVGRYVVQGERAGDYRCRYRIGSKGQPPLPVSKPAMRIPVERDGSTCRMVVAFGYLTEPIPPPPSTGKALTATAAWTAP